jgi:drug/metabolite transporter (DMT)-like permease
MDTHVTALALASAAFFGLALILTQLGLRETSAFRGAGMSVPTTALLFLLLAPLLLDTQAFDATSLTLFVLAGCLFPVTVTLLTFEANRRIGPNLTAALGNLTPLFAVVVAFALLGEAPRPGQLVGIAVILAGILLLVGARRGAAGSFAAGWALALPISAALIRGLVQPVVKLGLESWPSPFAAALTGYLISTLVILSAGFLREGPTFVVYRGRAWKWFAAVGVCNGAAVLSMYAALARGPVAVVAPLVACYPLATLAFGRLLIGSVGITWPIAVGAAITVAGVALLLGA